MPAFTIAKNGGKEGALIVDKILHSAFEVGYDARNDQYIDMIKAGIVDPTKVYKRIKLLTLLQFRLLIN